MSMYEPTVGDRTLNVGCAGCKKLVSALLFALPRWPPSRPHGTCWRLSVHRWPGVGRMLGCYPLGRIFTLEANAFWCQDVLQRDDALKCSPGGFQDSWPACCDGGQTLLVLLEAAWVRLRCCPVFDVEARKPRVSEAHADRCNEREVCWLIRILVTQVPRNNMGVSENGRFSHRTPEHFIFFTSAERGLPHRISPQNGHSNRNMMIPSGELT